MDEHRYAILYAIISIFLMILALMIAMYNDAIF